MPQIQTPRIERKFPIVIHKAYAKAKDVWKWRRELKRTNLNNWRSSFSRVSSWHTCPQCSQEFGEHELPKEGSVGAWIGDSSARPLCPECCKIFAGRGTVWATPPRIHECPHCGFHENSMTDLGLHMRSAHGSEYAPHGLGLWRS